MSHRVLNCALSSSSPCLATSANPHSRIAAVCAVASACFSPSAALRVAEEIPRDPPPAAAPPTEPPVSPPPPPSLLPLRSPGASASGPRMPADVAIEAAADGRLAALAAVGVPAVYRSFAADGLAVVAAPSAPRVGAAAGASGEAAKLDVLLAGPPRGYAITFDTHAKHVLMPHAPFVFFVAVLDGSTGHAGVAPEGELTRVLADIAGRWRPRVGIIYHATPAAEDRLVAARPAATAPHGAGRGASFQHAQMLYYNVLVAHTAAVAWRLKVGLPPPEAFLRMRFDMGLYSRLVLPPLPSADVLLVPIPDAPPTAPIKAEPPQNWPYYSYDQVAYGVPAAMAAYARTFEEITSCATATHADREAAEHAWNNECLLACSLRRAKVQQVRVHGMLLWDLNRPQPCKYWGFFSEGVSPFELEDWGIPRLCPRPAINHEWPLTPAMSGRTEKWPPYRTLK